MKKNLETILKFQKTTTFKNFFALAIANSLLEVDSWKGGGGMGGIGGKGTHVDYSHGYTSGAPACTTKRPKFGNGP